MYENIPSKEFEEAYIALRSDDLSVREDAIRGIVAANQFHITPREWVKQAGVLEIKDADGVTFFIQKVWPLSLRQTEDSIRRGQFSPWKIPSQIDSKRINQILVVQDDEDWDTQIYCFCNVPFCGIVVIPSPYRPADR